MNERDVYAAALELLLDMKRVTIEPGDVSKAVSLAVALRDEVQGAVKPALGPIATKLLEDFGPSLSLIDHRDKVHMDRLAEAVAEGNKNFILARRGVPQ